jgi:hypothetical protein
MVQCYNYSALVRLSSRDFFNAGNDSLMTPLRGISYLDDRSTSSQERDDEDGVFLVQFSVVGCTLSVDKHEACAVAVDTQRCKQTGDISSGRHLSIVQIPDLISNNSMQFKPYEHPVTSTVVI